MHPTQDNSDFGHLMVSHRCNMTPVYILVGVAVVCLLAGTMAVWLGYSRYHAPPSILDEMSFGRSARKSALTNGMIIGTLNVLVAMGCIPAALFQMSVRADLYERAVIVHRGRKNQVIRWEEISSVTLRREETQTFGANYRRHVVRFVVDITRAEGSVVELRGLKDIPTVAADVARHADVPLGRA